MLGRLWPLVGLLAAVGVAQLLEQGLGASVHRVGAVSLFSEGGASLWPEAAALAQVDVPGLLVPVLLISLVGFVSSKLDSGLSVSMMPESTKCFRVACGLPGLIHETRSLARSFKAQRTASNMPPMNSGAADSEVTAPNAMTP